MVKKNWTLELRKKNYEEKCEKVGVKTSLEYFWLRPWVPKALF
jgi:hypothetical protein